MRLSYETLILLRNNGDDGAEIAIDNWEYLATHEHAESHVRVAVFTSDDDYAVDFIEDVNYDEKSAPCLPLRFPLKS